MEEVQKEMLLILVNIYLNVGLQDPPKMSDVKNVFGFIQRNFKTLSLQDLVKAFDLYNGQQLEFSDPKFGHYGSFSLTFLGTILKAYKEWKRKEALKPKKREIVPVEKQIQERKLTKEENAKEWYDSVCKAIKNTSSDMILADWDAVYWYMNMNRMIDLTVDEKEMFLDNVKFEVQEEMSKRKLEGKDCSNYKRMIDDEKSLIRECKKRLVIKHLENELKD